MKKLQLLLLLSLISMTTSFAQMAVTAPNLEGMAAKNNANVLKQLAEAAKQSRTLQESADLLKKSTELYEKVNQKIKAIADIHTLTQEQIQLVREAGRAIKEARKIAQKNPKMLANYIDNVDRIVRANRKNVELLTSVLTDGLRLSDGERLKQISDVQANTRRNLTQLQAMKIMYSNSRSIQNVIFAK